MTKDEDFPQLLNAFDRIGNTVAEEWKDKQVTCLITDMYVGWGKEVGEALSVPWIAFCVASATDLSVYCNEASVSDVKISDIQAISVQTFHQSQLTFLLDNFVRKAGNLVHADRVLVNTVLALEQKVVESLQQSKVNAVTVGPLHLLSEKSSAADDENVDDPNKVLSWLDEQQDSSVLYIAFGATIPLPQGQIQQLASALMAACDVRFLWALRSQFVRELPSGFSSIARFRFPGGADKSSDLEKDKHRGFVTDWVPQKKVLKHRAISAFLTHSGWNSVLEAVAWGLPMIARPLSPEQVLNTKIMEGWGISVTLPGATMRSAVVDSEEIEYALETLRENLGKLKRKGGELGALARKAIQDKNGSSMLNLDSLAKDLHSWNLKSTTTVYD